MPLSRIHKSSLPHSIFSVQMKLLGAFHCGHFVLTNLLMSLILLSVHQLTSINGCSYIPDLSSPLLPRVSSVLVLVPPKSTLIVPVQVFILCQAMFFHKLWTKAPFTLVRPALCKHIHVLETFQQGVFQLRFQWSPLHSLKQKSLKKPNQASQPTNQPTKEQYKKGENNFLRRGNRFAEV